MLNKFNFRPLLRKLSCYIFFIISKLIYSDVKLCGIKYYKKFIKSSDTLFIIGPGASLLNISESDFQHINKKDSIAINYTIAHNIEFKCNLFETHEAREKGYFKILLNKNNKNQKNYFLIKGYNSPKKIFLHIKNILDFRNNKVNNILLMKDGYLSDYKKEVTTQIHYNERDDFILNHYASILYCIDLGLMANYEKIIFCGIDMSHDYFYFHGNYLSRELIKFLNKSSELNTHANNLEVQNFILEYFKKIILSSNIKIYSFKGSGPLNDILPKYNICGN